MLDTKFVKHLQSRPPHIKMFIFTVTMATAVVALFSLWLDSMGSTFLAATQTKSSSEKVVATAENNSKKENLPSLWNNMKANIGELSGTVAGAFSTLGDNSEKKTNSGIEKVRQIKPVKLPTNEQ